MKTDSIVETWLNWRYIANEDGDITELKIKYNKILEEVMVIIDYTDDQSIPYEIRKEYMDENEKRLLDLVGKLNQILKELGEEVYSDEFLNGFEI